MTRRAIRTSTFILAPLMMGLAAVSEPMVKLLLTEKWLPSIPYMRIFCITYMFYPIHTANLNAVQALGRSDIFLKLEMLKKVVGITAILITMNISVMAMAYSLLVTSVLSQIINSWPNRKLLNYAYLDQLKDIIPSVLLAVAMAACVYGIGYLKLPTVAILVIQVLTGAALYCTGAKILRLESFEYLLDLLKNAIRRRKSA